MRNRFLSAAIVAGIISGVTAGSIVAFGPASVPLIGNVYEAHVQNTDCYGLHLTVWEAYGPQNPKRDECEAMQREEKLGEQRRLLERIRAVEARKAEFEAKVEASSETP